jgi:hypothetical protein
MIFSIGCNNRKSSKIEPQKDLGGKKVMEPSKTKDYTIKDFYPFVSNRKLKYKGTGNEYTSKDVYVDFINENKIQIRIINPGTTLGQVLEYKDGELRLLNSREEFYYKDNLISEKSENGEVLLKEPLIEGKVWEAPKGKKRTITGVGVNVTTPAGDYSAIEVTTDANNGEDSNVKDYYVKGIGLVKTVFKSKDSEVVTALEKVEDNVQLPQTIKFYYPNIVKDKIMFKKDTIKLNTNDEIKNVFEKYFRETPSKELQPLISKDITINKVYLNTKENKAYIDFSKDFSKYASTGTSKELGILKGITNTLGDYYNVDKVHISVEGKPYSSGHIAMKEGEYFTVDYKNTEEIK